jgi:hypothetical protein
MKKYQLKYYDQNCVERKCEMFGESESDIRRQFKEFGYFKDCYITFLKCEQDEERSTMLKSISAVIRNQSFSLN